jgi:hypothetical protein
MKVSASPKEVQTAMESVLQAFDPELSLRFVVSEDPESEDDEFQLLLNGEELKRGLCGAAMTHATYTIQSCLFGPDFAVNEHVHNGERLRYMSHLYEGNDPQQAAAAIVDSLKKSTKRTAPKRDEAKPSPEIASLQSGMIGQAEKVEVDGRFEFDLSASPSVTIRDTETGRTFKTGLYAYREVRGALAAFFPAEGN